MKLRNRRQLNKLHLYTHKRFHEATDPNWWRLWLALRTSILKLIIEATE